MKGEGSSVDSKNHLDSEHLQNVSVKPRTYLEQSPTPKPKLTKTPKIIGYWSPPERGLQSVAEMDPGYPDPRQLIGGWDRTEQDAVIAYLRGTGVHYGMKWMGYSCCRICGGFNGTADNSDGEWVWPSGLIHYVRDHDVRLPTEFVETALSATREGRKPKVLPFKERDGSWRHALLPHGYDNRFWLRWAQQNTPSLPDAIPFDEARRICHELSHEAWQFEIQNEAPLWRVRYRARHNEVDQHFRPCSASALERKVLRWRQPDPNALLDVERANAIAAEYAGSWSWMRIEDTGPEGWEITIYWPARESCEGSELDDDSCATKNIKVETPRDERCWRWWLTSEREHAEVMARFRRNKEPWPTQIDNE